MLKYFIGLLLLTIACGCSQDGLENEALDRYKESSFAIPWTAKAATESEFAFRERLNAAHVLMNEYAEEASSWKRFAFPRIREKLTPDDRAEFDRKCAELLSFPSPEEFRRSPMMTRMRTKTPEGVRCTNLDLMRGSGP